MTNYIPVDGVGKVPVGGDEEEAAARDVARQLASLQRLIAVLRVFNIPVRITIQWKAVTVTPSEI